MKNFVKVDDKPSWLVQDFSDRNSKKNSCLSGV
jgi:hypothetical protein